MASKSAYECFVCQKNGFPNVRVYLDGKTEAGKTIYKNEDMSLHQHRYKDQQSQQPVEAAKSQLPQQEQEETFIERVTSESIQRGITAFKLFSDLALHVEGIGIDVNQTRVSMERIEGKIDRLLRLFVKDD